jgi:hypothetical protein
MGCFAVVTMPAAVLRTGELPDGPVVEVLRAAHPGDIQKTGRDLTLYDMASGGACRVSGVLVAAGCHGLDGSTRPWVP